MSMEPGFVFARTPKAALELGSRGHGLPLRQRQLLILFDGRRTLAELARFVPPAQLLSWSESLQRDGYIAQREASTPADTPSKPISSTDPPLAQTLQELRERLRRALLDMTGPHGNAMAERIERAASLEELRALRVPAAAVVEAVQGHGATGLFAQRVGQW